MQTRASSSAAATFADDRRNRRWTARWLLLVATLVFAMVVVGGATRLTESGLSITEWKPVSGAIPPLNDAQWAAEFEAYKKIPEYVQEHAWMSLDDFKAIYWWEFGHRLLGRVIGLAYGLPFLWLLWRQRVPRGYGWRLTGLLALGGLQGAIGWWMVASGLVERTDVSHYRLAVHLTTALLIFAGLLWTALDLTADRHRVPAPTLRWPAALFLLLLLAQVIMGAFVAGLNAGFAFNTWPLMGDSFVPPMLWDAALGWLNIIENPVAVQFIHRIVAYVLFVAGLWAIWRGWASGIADVMVRAGLLGAALLLQLVLGILTIVEGVPILLGVAHQGGAVVLLAAAVLYAHRGRDMRRVA